MGSVVMEVFKQSKKVSELDELNRKAAGKVEWAGSLVKNFTNESCGVDWPLVGCHSVF